MYRDDATSGTRETLPRVTKSPMTPRRPSIGAPRSRFDHSMIGRDEYAQRANAADVNVDDDESIVMRACKGLISGSLHWTHRRTSSLSVKQDLNLNSNVRV